MSAINIIQDSSNVGGVAGSPGTLPVPPNVVGFGWQLFPTNTSLIVTLSFGIVTSIPFMDVHFAGISNSTTLQVLFGTCAANANTPYVLSVYNALITGTLTNITDMGVNWDNYTGAPDSLVNPFSSSGAFVPFTPTSTLTRTAAAATSSGVCTVIYPSIFMDIINGASIDFTLRIGGTQLEQGTTPSTFQSTPILISPFDSQLFKMFVL